MIAIPTELSNRDDDGALSVPPVSVRPEIEAVSPFPSPWEMVMLPPTVAGSMVALSPLALPWVMETLPPTLVTTTRAVSPAALPATSDCEMVTLPPIDPVFTVAVSPDPLPWVMVTLPPTDVTLMVAVSPFPSPWVMETLPVIVVGSMVARITARGALRDRDTAGDRVIHDQGRITGRIGSHIGLGDRDAAADSRTAHGGGIIAPAALADGGTAAGLGAGDGGLIAGRGRNTRDERATGVALADADTYPRPCRRRSWPYCNIGVLLARSAWVMEMLPMTLEFVTLAASFDVAWEDDTSPTLPLP